MDNDPNNECTFSPAGGALDGVDIIKCFKQAFCLKILVCGKTGVGKSTLINSVVGSEVCKENDPGCEGGHLGAGTLKVSETKINIDNVFVSIYDSPGLQDGTKHEDDYLQDMYDKCKDANLILYCMEMTTPRFSAIEKRAIELMTNKFGHDFWKHCVLVMTKANMVRVPPSYRNREREYHRNLYNTLLAEFQDQLINQHLPEDVARTIPGVATGYFHPESDNECYVWYVSNKAKASDRPVDFLAELWVTCFDRTASDSQAKFLRATTRQRIKPLPEATVAEKRFQKQIEDLEKQQKELCKRYEDDLKREKDKFKRELDQLREEYSTKNWPVAPPSQGSISPTRDQYDRMAGATVGATAGGLIFGPIGVIVGGFLGFLL